MNGHRDVPAEMRERIFDAALVELVKSGIDAFSVGEVARRAGINRRLIDDHWPHGRVLLMDAMLTRAADAVPIPDEGSLGRDLRRYVDALAHLASTRFARQQFRRLLPGDDDMDFSEVRSDFWAFQMAAVEQMFHHAAERGELRSDIDFGQAARMLVAALVYDIVFHDSPMNREYAEQVCSILLAGMLTSDATGLMKDFRDSESTRSILRLTCDGIIDPIALVEAVRDSDGRIANLVYREVNQAACTFLQRSRNELLGARLIETLQDLAASGLLVRCMDALETGRPLEIEDCPYFSRRYSEVRRFDLRAMPVGGDRLSMVWRDVSDRYRAQQHAIETGQLSAALGGTVLP